MSHYTEEVCDVYDEIRPKARIEHQCDACKEMIPPGDYYWKIAIVYDGNARTVKRCLRCQEIHRHLRTLAPGEMWPDEKLNCGEDYKDHWGTEPPPEIAALAFKTREELQDSMPGRRREEEASG